MIDPWTSSELAGDELPLAGAAALALTLAGVTAGVLAVAGGLVAAAWLRNHLTWRR